MGKRTAKKATETLKERRKKAKAACRNSIRILGTLAAIHRHQVAMDALHRTLPREKEATIQRLNTLAAIHQHQMALDALNHILLQG